MSDIWRCHQQPQDPWLTSVVTRLHPVDQLHDLQLSRKLSPLEARQASNRSRCEQLYAHGGLWLDNDLIPLRCLTGAPAAWIGACGGHYEPCAMWFPAPGHRFLEVVMDLMDRLPAQLLQRYLQRAATIVPIAQEPRVLPFDAWGRSQHVLEPWAVHTWATSARRAVAFPA